MRNVELYVNTKVPDPLTESTMAEIVDHLQPNLGIAVKHLRTKYDVAWGRMGATRNELRWDFREGEVWLRTTFECRVSDEVYGRLYPEGVAYG